MASFKPKNPNTMLGGQKGQYINQVIKTTTGNLPGQQDKKIGYWKWNGAEWVSISESKYVELYSQKDVFEQDHIQATQDGELVSDDIRNKFKKYSPQLAEASKSLRYPNDVSIANTSDFVIFNFYDYKPPFQERNSIGASLPYMTKNGKKVRYQDTTVTNFSLDQYNQSGNLQEYFNSPAYKQVLLYMPDDVQDAYSAQWEGKAFGAAAAGILSSGGARGMSNKFMQSLKTLGENLSRSPANTAASLITGLTNTITGDKITQQDVFGGMSGVIKNPNVELLFQNMKLRTFDLTFKLAPYNVKEANTIREIIQTFKKAMLPQYNIQEGVNVLGYKPYQDDTDAGNMSLQAAFIQVPKLCHVGFMKGSEQHPYLPRYKMCAITDMNVNYTPDGNYSAFVDGHPVATELKLSFMETKLIFSEDIGSGPGSASYEADKEYAYGGM